MEGNQVPEGGQSVVKQSSSRIIAIVVIIVLIVGAFFLLKGGKGEGEIVVDTNMPIPDATGGVVETEVVKEFTVTGQNFSFDIKTITVNKGDTVKITFKNVDGLHDFVIDEFGINSGRLSGGQDTAVPLTPDKA